MIWNRQEQEVLVFIFLKYQVQRAALLHARDWEVGGNYTNVALTLGKTYLSEINSSNVIYFMENNAIVLVLQYILH